MSVLVLVPTRLELGCLPEAPASADVIAGRGTWRGADVALCGLGVADAGSGAAAAIARCRPDFCVLIGLTGTYDTDFAPVGSAVAAAWIVLHGIGADYSVKADGAKDHLSLREMGLPEEATGVLPRDDREVLTVPDAWRNLPVGGLLTVCAASGDEPTATTRATTFHAVIEDMEGYAVARAARLFDVPLACLRGVCNVAGDRDKSRWQFKQAMAAMHEPLSRLSGAFR